jgi:nucleotide-binding universal stress UspA family protein
MVPLIKHILYLTDFSENAHDAISFALEIARRSDATLHVLHSIEEPYDLAPMQDEIKKAVTRNVQQLLDAMVEEIRTNKNYRNITVETHIRTGRTLYSVLDVTRMLSIDLVVTGSRGRSKLKSVFFGNTAAELIQHSSVPVLAVPPKVVYTGLEQILFVTDYNDGDVEALQFVVELGKLFGSNIEVFHAAGENNLKAELLFRGFNELIEDTFDYPLIDFEQSASVSFFNAVADQVDRDNASLLVMMRYQNPYSLIGKSHSKKMSYYTRIPLLVIPSG